MKYILLSLFATGSIFAMPPQSKIDCFLAHTKFKALVTFLSSGNAVAFDKNGNETATESFNQLYEEFLKECKEERVRKDKIITGIMNGSIDPNTIDMQ